MAEHGQNNNSRYLAEIGRRTLVFDGAMGTMIQNLGLTAADYGGERLDGCPEILAISQPDAIRDIHRAYLAAGADVVETDTFTGTRLKLDDYDLGERTHEINSAAARLARAAADEFTTPERPRFVAGSMDTMEEGPNGALYRLDPDFSLHKLDDKIIVSNGPCWSPDGSIFYFADTWTGEIWAYDYDQSTGAASNRRTFVKVDRSRGGAADGSTVDAEGCVWNALVYDGRLVRYDPSGRVDRVIEMPVKKVTSVMFGGPKLDVLFVTSMAKPPLPRFPGDGLLRGSLFAIYDLGIRGLPEPRFGA